MTVIHLNPEEVPAVLAGHAKNMPHAFHKAALKAAHRARARLVRESPVYTGQFKNSWKVIDFGSPAGATVRNDAPHAGIIEKGARPHKVSREGFEAIKAWARKKLIGRSSRKNFLAAGGKLSKAALSTTGKKGKHWADVEAERIAWAIVKKLEKYGQKGTVMVQKLMPNFSKWLAVEVSKEVLKVIKAKGYPMGGGK
jgi:hypothetical protein